MKQKPVDDDSSSEEDKKVKKRKADTDSTNNKFEVALKDRADSQTLKNFMYANIEHLQS